MKFLLLLQTAEGEAEETTDNGFVEDAADVDARKMALKAAEGLELDTYLRYSFTICER